MLSATLPKINAFKGLNTVSDPVRLGLGWLVKADNVDVTDTGALVKRTGYSKVMSGSPTSAFATRNFDRAYFVDGGSLKSMIDTGTTATLKTGLSSNPMFWTEVNRQVYFNNGADAGVIEKDGSVKDWRWTVMDSPDLAVVTGALPAGLYRVCCTYLMPDGRETGASDPTELTLVDGQALQVRSIPIQAGCMTRIYIAPADSTVFSLAWSTSATTAFVWNNSPDDLGVDLATDGLDPLPTGADVIQHWKGRMYAAQYFPADDMTAIWFSQPLGFHLFNLGVDFIAIPGKVLMLAATETALVVGTSTRIYAYSPDGLNVLADYGVVPGMNWSVDDDQSIVFWSVRGLCRALPFSNLTEQSVSVAPGVMAGGTIVRSGGQKRYIAVIQQGGTAFNSQ